MSLRSVDDIPNTATCIAGHEWEPTGRSGNIASACPRHVKFFRQQLSARLKPPKMVVQEWAEQAKMLDDDEYVDRWKGVWNNTVRLLGARFETWVKVDPKAVELYVRSLRLAELHRLYAQDHPYIEGRGTVKAHPGWELSEKEERKARQLALDMGLVDPPGVPAPAEDKPQAAGHYKTRMQQSAGDHDSVIPALGPDGEAL